MDLALNNLPRLICLKTQTNNMLTASLQRGKSPSPQQVSEYDTNPSDGEGSSSGTLWNM